MSPFKSTKLGFLSNSAKYILQRDNEVGAAVTHTGQYEWSYGDYNYIAFTGPGTFEVQRSGYMDFCLVGGGGGGGNGALGPPFTGNHGAAGGGGSGGIHHIYDHKAKIGTYDVTIGTGGATGAAGGPAPGSPFSWGYAGSATSITSPHINPSNYEFYATGGGGGIGGDGTPPYNQAGPRAYGASGGGACFNSGSDVARDNYANTIVGTTDPLAPYQPNGVVQGYAGSNGTGGGGGGGGGGAGGTGMIASPYTSGGVGGPGVRIFAGDVGVNPPATPSNLDLGEASPANVSPGRYVCGGGGGGSAVTSNPNIDVGGLGGGGSQFAYNVGDSGQVNTGGGGAGGSEPGVNPGGSGGPGLVVIRYLRVVDAG
jgi:hypothetical protein